MFSVYNPYHFYGVKWLCVLMLRFQRIFSVNNPYVFLGVGGLVLGYLLYMIIRKRKGERPDSAVREPEL